MYSKRQYPPRICRNPDCKCEFIPHDRRQFYCERQCRTNANNDKKHFLDNSRFIEEKLTRMNNKILEKIWKKLTDQKKKLVSKTILEWEKFKFDSQSLIRQNKNTSSPILWFHDYGLEYVDRTKEIFEIHKRSY